MTPSQETQHLTAVGEAPGEAVSATAIKDSILQPLADHSAGPTPDRGGEDNSLLGLRPDGLSPSPTPASGPADYSEGGK